MSESVNDRFYAICYDCSDEDDGQEPEQKQLVTDGGYDAVTIDRRMSSSLATDGDSNRSVDTGTSQSGGEDRAE